MTDAALEALWKTVLDHWDEERAHAAFLEYCRTTEKLAEAATRYRGMKGDRDRSEVAEKRLAGIAIIALSMLEATRTRARPRERKLGSLLLATCFGVLAVGLMAYLISSR